MYRMALAVFVLLTCTVIRSTHADDDLDSLLNELTFGESKLVNLATPTIDQPSGMPLSMPTTLQTAPLLEPLPPAVHPLNLPPPSVDPLALDAPAPMPLEDSANSIQTPPVAVPSPNAPPAFEAPIHFNQYFANEGYGDSCAKSCDAISLACAPHRPPTLPPPSTFLQYMQSDNCHSDVWAGYAEERMRKCEKWHSHLHGRCDCFNKGHKRCNCCQAPAPAPARASCDCGNHL